MKITLRVGTRGSALAITQTNQVISLLRESNPSLDIETVVIRTTGDIQSEQASTVSSSKGVFVKEIEDALISGQVDFAIHSVKDLPGELAPGLEIAAIPPRENACDVLVSHSMRLSELPEGAKIGTGSPRRMALVQSVRPDLRIEEIRGNIDTRLRKWRDGKYDAILLAAAGLRRMGLEGYITEQLDPCEFIPAPGQGALALEIRKDSHDVHELLERLNHMPTFTTVMAERRFQSELGSGCSLPAGAYAYPDKDIITMHAFLASSTVKFIARAQAKDSIANASDLGKRIAEELRIKVGEDRPDWHN